MSGRLRRTSWRAGSGRAWGPSPTTSAHSSNWVSSSSWTKRACGARSSTTTERVSAPSSRPRAGPRRHRSPSRLDVIADYARASAAAGGFDRADAQLRRALYRLDAKGFAQLSKACDKLIEQADKIGDAAAARIANKDPHDDDIVDAGLGLMLFDAVRLSGTQETDGRKPASRRASRSRRATVGR